MSEESTAAVAESTASETTSEETEAKAAEIASVVEGKAGDPPKSEASAEPSFDYAKWADGLTDESKKDYAKRFKGLDDILDGSLNLRKEISSRVKVPGANAKPDEIAAFHKAIGAGEKAEDYKVGAPDGYEMGEVQNALVNVMQQRALEKGIPKSAFEEFTKAYFETEVAVQKKVEQEVRDFRIESEAKLRAEHGKDYDRRLRAGNALIDKIDPSGEVRALLDDNITWKGATIKLGDHPAMLKTMAELGLRMGEDSVLAVNSADEAKSLDEQIREFERKHPIGRRTREQEAQRMALYQKRYPS